MKKSVLDKGYIEVVDNYEPPTENFIDMDTTDKSVKECVDEILNVCG